MSGVTVVPSVSGIKTNGNSSGSGVTQTQSTSK